jgi:putative ABC transport system permease protein
MAVTETPTINPSPGYVPAKVPRSIWGRMTPFDTFRFAWRALRDNKMRSALTMLGVIIGVAAVVTALAVGQGAAGAVTNSVGQLGNNSLYIVPSNPRIGPGDPGGLTQTLKPEDGEAILDRCRATVVRMCPMITSSVLVKAGNNNWRTNLTAAPPNFFVVNSYTIAHGRQLTIGDENTKARVCCLGKTVIENLFGDKDYNCVGQEIALNRVRFQVVGILDAKGTNTFGQDQDNQVLVPLSTGMFRITSQKYVNAISVECRNPDVMDLAQEQIVGLLRQRHHLQPPFPDNDDFTVLSQSQLLAIMTTITGAMTILLASIAAISLTVGGIGIMNIMLVSVTERTREIGIRKALGATESNIRWQFLIESALLSLAGGMVGILFGGGIAAIAAKATGWPIAPSPFAVALAVGVSAGIGIFFGYWPARKAARLHPIDALRRE